MDRELAMNAPDLSTAGSAFAIGPADAATAERPLVFACEGERLLGILHAAEGSVGVIVVVGGPQYRAGSHRHFVEVARALAAAGSPVLRFDMRGMGDSSGPLHEFERVTADIGAAIAALQAHQPQVRRVALWGLCDGASAALLYLHEQRDARVAGLCLLNPWVRSAQSLARTHVKHYYRQRLMEKEFWLKLLRGGVARKALTGLWANLRQAGAAVEANSASFQTRMAHAWRGFSGPTHLVLSGKDHTAREFVDYASTDAAWSGALKRANVQTLDLPDADHTLSTADARLALNAACLRWLETIKAST